jgi:hypothetical protein
MTISDLGSIGELVSGIGVIVTLIYLAIQVRQNTQAMRESQRLARVDAMTTRNDVIERSSTQAAINPEILEIRLRALNGGVAVLSELEIARLRHWEIARAMRLEGQYFQWENGLLDDDYYDQFRRAVSNSAPLWKEMDIDYGRPTFRDAIDRILSERDA